MRYKDMCEATVTLDPREAESADESTMLEIRWTWVGKVLSDVPDRVTRTHLNAKEARSLAEAIDGMGKSRCVVEQAVAPAECVGVSHIVWVEAEP